MGVDRTIDITAEQRKIVMALLKQHLPGTAAWAYGSRAKWTTRPQSDFDLVVFTTEEQNSQVGPLRDAFEESSLPFRVDLFVWDAIPEAFRQQIEAEHIVLTQQEKRYEIDGWRETRLGDVIELKRGYDLPKYKRLPGPVPVVSSSGPTDHHVKIKVEGPGVVTGRYGTLGQVFFIPQDFWPLNTTLYVRDFKRNDPQFIAYFLQGLDFSAYSDKAAVPGLNRNHLHEKIVRFPTDIDEQRAMAHVLGTLDDKIELNRRTNETLEAMARALFKSWFVDFDPVRAKMEGRDPGLPQRITDLFPDRLVDSELGEIPAGWEVKALGDVLELTYGKALKADSRRGGSVPVYGSNGRVGWHDEKLAEGPGIVVGRKGTPGVVTWISTDFFAIDTTFIVMPKGGTQVLLFLFFALQQQDLPSIAADSAVPGLNRHLAYMNRQLIPDAAVVERFDKQVGVFFTRRSQLEGESHVLAAVRDTLLPKLVSGELRVQNTERQ